MGRETIIVDIDPKGGVNIEADGFKDATCLKATENLEKAFGGNVAERKKKAEAHITPKLTTGTKVNQ